MLTVYLETNSLIAAATGQDADMDEVLQANGHTLHLVVPEICLMEALSVIEGKRRERNIFAQSLDHQIVQLRRDLTSSSS